MGIQLECFIKSNSEILTSSIQPQTNSKISKKTLTKANGTSISSKPKALNFYSVRGATETTATKSYPNGTRNP